MQSNRGFKMRDVKVLPYKAGSHSARDLANALGCSRISLTNSRIHNLRPKKIINWGNSGRNLPPEGLGAQHTILNPLVNVKVAGNKLTALQTLSEAGVRVPDFTTDAMVARYWLLDDGQDVVVRHTLTGSGGDGIELLNRENDDLIPEAPLYTKYVKKQDEYRIHVMNGVVIDMQRKARNTEVADEDVNWQIRNHGNGFIFMRENVNPDQDVINQAVAAIYALGLDFGAVDVVWNAHQSQAYVLEVNTACGLEGTTLERYTAAFQAVLNGERPESVSPTPPAEPASVEALPLGGIAYAVAGRSGDAVLTAEAPPEPIEYSAPQEQQYRVVTDRRVQVGDMIRYTWALNSNISSGSIGTVHHHLADDGGFVAVYDNDHRVAHSIAYRDIRWEIVEPVTAETAETVEEEENISPSEELFDIPVVQSNTGRSSKFLLAINNQVDIEEGIFNSREEAESSDLYHNVRQILPNATINIVEL